MIHLKPCDIDTIELELQILNSQRQYMKIAYHKELLTIEDVLLQHEEAAQYRTERYIVLDGNIAIGIVDYGFSSPLQRLPWINLLCIDAQYARKGYAKKVFQLVEQNMYKGGATVILLAVHAVNERARQFWEEQQFVAFKERDYEGDRYISYKKTIQQH